MVESVDAPREMEGGHGGQGRCHRGEMALEQGLKEAHALRSGQDVTSWGMVGALHDQGQLTMKARTLQFSE